jgi:hypothetical protein
VSRGCHVVASEQERVGSGWEHIWAEGGWLREMVSAGRGKKGYPSVSRLVQVLLFEEFASAKIRQEKLRCIQDSERA